MRHTDPLDRSVTRHSQAVIGLRLAEVALRWSFELCPATNVPKPQNGDSVSRKALIQITFRFYNFTDCSLLVRFFCLYWLHVHDLGLL